MYTSSPGHCKHMNPYYIQQFFAKKNKSFEISGIICLSMGKVRALIIKCFSLNKMKRNSYTLHSNRRVRKRDTHSSTAVSPRTQSSCCNISHLRARSDPCAHSSSSYIYSRYSSSTTNYHTYMIYCCTIVVFGQRDMYTAVDGHLGCFLTVAVLRSKSKAKCYILLLYSSF